MEHPADATRSPAWWTKDQDGRWDHVKAAFRRDWEQTKADISGGRTGTDLNQNIDDTMGQAFGKRAIPGETTANAMTDAELKTHVHRAANEMDRTAKHLAKDAEKSIAKNEDASGAHRWSQWDEAEAPIRYGHGAASYYGTTWDDDTEVRLRNEWVELYPARPWDEVRDTVRLGWGPGGF